MEAAASLSYVLSRLPLVLLFAGGFLSYRLLAVTGLTDWLVRQAVLRSRGSASLLVLFIILVTALISAFIPNTVAVLAAMPAVAALDRDQALGRSPCLSTPLALAVMYGANVGGVGSLIGSPANLILLGALDLYRVPGAGQLTFLNWLAWGLPLALLLALAGWGVITALALPRSVSACRLAVDEAFRGAALGPVQLLAARLYLMFLGFWAVESALRGLWPGFEAWEPWACLAFSAWFVRQCFCGRGPGLGGRPLLLRGEILQDFPMRALFFLLLLGAVMVAANALGLDRMAASGLEPLARNLGTPFALILALTLASVFLSEILSNTVVAVALFPLAALAAQVAGTPPLSAMVAVSVGATCAFMTPLATPSNALAFGMLRQASLPRMILAGAVMNVICGLVLAAWVQWVLSLFYG